MQRQQPVVWSEFDFHVLDLLKLLCEMMDKHIHTGLTALVIMKRYWQQVGRTCVHPTVLLMTCFNISLKMDEAKLKHFEPMEMTLKKAASTPEFSLWMPKEGFKKRSLLLEIPVLRRIKFKIFVPFAHRLIDKERLTNLQLKEAWALLTLFYASDMILTRSPEKLAEIASITAIKRSNTDYEVLTCIRNGFNEMKRITNPLLLFQFEPLFTLHTRN